MAKVFEVSVKILLINPPISSQERYGRDIGDIGGHQAPLGLCSLAASMRQVGHEVAILDAELMRMCEDAVLAHTRTYGPDLIGLTSTTVAYPRACRVAAKLRSALPHSPVVIGGCHVSSNPEETLSSGLFDAAVLREGEFTFRHLVEVMAARGPLSEVPGIAYRQDDEVVLTEPRPYIEDLDVLPFPAFDLLANRSAYMPPIGSYKNRPVVNLVTSRGCPYRCIFCDKTVFGQRYRFNSAEYVLAEVDHVVTRFGAREVAFLDDSFTVGRDRVLGICEGLRRRRQGVTWTCMTRANLVDRDLLRDMRRAGCWQIAVGVESGSQAVLDLANKGETLDDIKRCITDAASLGIMVKGFFVLGLPGETPETLRQTIALAKASPLTDVVVTVATPMPGSPLYRMAPKYGRYDPVGWDKLCYWWPVFVPWGLSAGHILRAQRQLYRTFYGRVSVLGRQVRKIGSVAELVKYCRNVWRLLRPQPRPRPSPSSTAEPRLPLRETPSAAA